MLLRIYYFNLNSFFNKSDIYREKTQYLIKNALKDAEAESALQGVMRMEVEIQRATKFLQISTDLRRYQHRVNVSINILKFKMTNSLK